MTETEINTAMKNLRHKQLICLKITVLIFITTIFSSLLPLMFLHAAVMIFYGNSLSFKAARLCREKYPYIPLAISSFGKNSNSHILIINEARKLGDRLTLKLLSFDRQTVWLFSASILCYIVKLILFDSPRI